MTTKTTMSSIEQKYGANILSQVEWGSNGILNIGIRDCLSGSIHQIPLDQVVSSEWLFITVKPIHNDGVRSSFGKRHWKIITVLHGDSLSVNQIGHTLFVVVELTLDSLHIFHVLDELSIGGGSFLTFDLHWVWNEVQDVIIVWCLLDSLIDIPLNVRISSWLEWVEGLLLVVSQLRLSVSVVSVLIILLSVRIFSRIVRMESLLQVVHNLGLSGFAIVFVDITELSVRVFSRIMWVESLLQIVHNLGLSLLALDFVVITDKLDS